MSDIFDPVTLQQQISHSLTSAKTTPKEQWEQEKCKKKRALESYFDMGYLFTAGYLRMLLNKLKNKNMCLKLAF